MKPDYRDRDGDVWTWDADAYGYFAGDMGRTYKLDEVRDKFGPLEVRYEDSTQWSPEPESQEQLLRRIIREELDRRFGRVHT